MDDKNQDTSANNTIIPMSVKKGSDGIRIISFARNRIEKDPKYAAILKEADDFVAAEQIRLGIPNLHSWMFLDPIKKKYLKEKHGVDWLTRDECNPGVQY